MGGGSGVPVVAAPVGPGGGAGQGEVPEPGQEVLLLPVLDALGAGGARRGAAAQETRLETWLQGEAVPETGE